MALDFNGSSSSIALTLTDDQKAITQCTISFFEDLDNNGQYKRPFDFDAGAQDWRLEFDDGWGYVFVAPFSTTEGKWSIAKPSTGYVHHIMILYDGSSTGNDPVIYLDNVSQSITERSTPVGTLVLPTGNAWIGSDDGTGQYFDGRLAEFAIYNKLADSTLRAALSAGYSPAFFPDGLLFHHPFRKNETPAVERISKTSGVHTNTSFYAHPGIIKQPGRPTKYNPMRPEFFAPGIAR